jgi:hypothetical protein
MVPAGRRSIDTTRSQPGDGRPVGYPALVSGRRTRVVLATLLGVVLLIVAIVYWAQPAHSLPSFFPGHVGATDHEATTHHVKHGIAAFVCALGAFAYAWFASGPGPQVDGPTASS